VVKAVKGIAISGPVLSGYLPTLPQQEEVVYQLRALHISTGSLIPLLIEAT
jgi:hypothetical protein